MARPQGFKSFFIIWLGQAVSMLGSGLTGFALGVWVYQQTGSATLYALMALFVVLPGILLAPIAGALVDRWDRRKAMVLSDFVAALCGGGIAVLLWSGRLEIWHLYVLQGLASTGMAWQWPAFSALMTVLVPKQHLGRAGGLVQFGAAASQILAPLMAGTFIARVGLHGVIVMDVVTFLFSLATLAVVRSPVIPVSAQSEAARGRLLREAKEGWWFIRQRPGLQAMLLLFAATNFSLAILQVLITPLVLGFASTAVLGWVVSVAGLGMLAGAVFMSVWGGPPRRIHGILGFLTLQGVILLLGGLRPNAVLVASAAFVFLFASPILEGCSRAIWQTKVPPDLQGRVFSVRRMVAWSTLPLAYLLAGPLADRVFEPLMAPGGLLAGTLGQVLGTGKGRGIGLLFMVLGVLVLGSVVAAARHPRLCRIEIELPDALSEAKAPAAVADQRAP